MTFHKVIQRREQRLNHWGLVSDLLETRHRFVTSQTNSFHKMGTCFLTIQSCSDSKCRTKKQKKERKKEATSGTRQTCSRVRAWLHVHASVWSALSFVAAAARVFPSPSASSLTHLWVWCREARRWGAARTETRSVAVRSERQQLQQGEEEAEEEEEEEVLGCRQRKRGDRRSRSGSRRERPRERFFTAGVLIFLHLTPLLTVTFWFYFGFLFLFFFFFFLIPPQSPPSVTALTMCRI